MFNDNGNIKLWEDIKIEVHHKDNKKIYWFQIIYALTKSWKDTILKDKWNAKNNKLTSRKLYLILVDVNTVKPTPLRLLYAILNFFTTRHHIFKHISINAVKNLASRPSLIKQFPVSANIFASSVKVRLPPLFQV